MSLKYHWGAVLLVLSLGITMLLPFYFLETRETSTFKGILPSLTNDDWYYTARVQDSIDGNYFLSNIYLFEHKDGFPQQTFFAEYLLARPLKLFNLNAAHGRLIYSFLLPMLACALSYAIFYSVLKKRLLAVLFTALIFFHILPYKFLRPVSPQFNFIFWLVLFLSLWKIANGNRHKVTVVVAILSFGFLFYLYPYYWTYYAIFLTLLGAAYAYFLKDWRLAKVMFLVLGLGFVIGSYYFYFNYVASGLPDYEPSLTRLGMIYTRFPSGIRVLVPGGAVLLLFALGLRTKIFAWNAPTIYMATGVAAMMIAVNQHVLTNRNLLFAGHFYQQGMFMIVFASSYLTARFLDNYGSKRVVRGLVFGGGLIVAALCLSTMNRYIAGSKAGAQSEKISYMQNYRSIFDWLNKNSERESVVFANEEVSNLIPIYTANNIFYARNANLFILSEEEVMYRFLAQNYFEEFDREFVIDHAQHAYGARYVAQYGHIQQRNKLFEKIGIEKLPEVFLPEDKIEAVLAGFKKMKQQPFADAIKKYRVDYIVWDAVKDPQWRIEGNSAFSKVYEANGIRVYRVL